MYLVPVFRRGSRSLFANRADHDSDEVRSSAKALERSSRPLRHSVRFLNPEFRMALCHIP